MPNNPDDNSEYTEETASGRKIRLRISNIQEQFSMSLPVKIEVIEMEAFREFAYVHVYIQHVCKHFYKESFVEGSEFFVVTTWN